MHLTLLCDSSAAAPAHITQNSAREPLSSDSSSLLSFVLVDVLFGVTIITVVDGTDFTKISQKLSNN